MAVIDGRLASVCPMRLCVGYEAAHGAGADRWGEGG